MVLAGRPPGIGHAAAAPAPRSVSPPAGGRQTDDQTLVLATNRAPSDLDPHAAYDAGSLMVLRGPFETLIRVEVGTTDRYEPSLARSWEANADKSVWTFQLEDGVAFQDGTPCDADAVRASFERLLALGYGPSTVLGRFVQDAAQITVPDARTVVFDLGRPHLHFEGAISALSGGAIVNARLAMEHEVNGDRGHAWAMTGPPGLGTGPYRVAETDVYEGTILERHDAYRRGWDGGRFDRVSVRIVAEAETRRQMIERGDADIVDNVSPESLSALQANPDLVVDLQYNLTVSYLILTVAGPLATPSARQAICYAFPYDEVIQGVYEGYAKRAIGPCAELLQGFNPETFVYQTDLARAGALLDEAGVPDGTTLTLAYPSSASWVSSIAQLLGANLDRIGLNLDIQQTDFATYVSIAYGEAPTEERPHLMPSFWSPDYNDGWNHLWPQVSSAAWTVGNAGHYANPEVDALLADARDAADEATYADAHGQIQQIDTRDDPAAVYFAQPQGPTILRADIGGYVPNLVNGGQHDFRRLFRRR